MAEIIDFIVNTIVLLLAVGIAIGMMMWFSYEIRQQKEDGDIESIKFFISEFKKKYKNKNNNQNEKESLKKELIEIKDEITNKEKKQKAQDLIDKF